MLNDPLRPTFRCAFAEPITELVNETLQGNAASLPHLRQKPATKPLLAALWKRCERVNHCGVNDD
jgi:hypothetical protein